MSDFTVFDIETTGRTPWASEFLCAGISHKAYWKGDGRRRAAALLKAPGIVVEHTMFDARWLLLDGAELGPETEVHDTRTMAWLVDEDDALSLDALMLRYLGETIIKPIKQRANVPVWSTEVWPIPGEARAFVPLGEVPRAIMMEYNEMDLDEEARLYVKLRDLLVREKLWDMFLAKEVPLSRSIVLMEAAGLPFDLEENEALKGRVAGQADELEAELHDRAGAPLKLRSPLQIGTYLFSKGGVEIPARVRIGEEPENFVAEKVGRIWATGHYRVTGRGLNAPPPKRRSGHDAVTRISAGKDTAALREWSTASTDLVMENVEDEFVQDFVLWRELDKLGGYLEKYPTFLGPDGRMHGTINRCGTVTGRFSSSEPNLQQIPAHGQHGPAVRALFRGDLVVADYAQLENRVMAHFSQDAGLLKSYRDNVDLYGFAAAMLFGGEPTKDHEKRGLMKTTILGLQYGAGFAKLGMLMTRGGHPTDLHGAKELVLRLRFEAFPDMFAWRDETAERAVKDGVVTTLAGRKRRFEFDVDWPARRAKVFPDLVYDESAITKGKDKSAWDYRRRVKATPRDMQQLTMERQAISAVVSGSAADIVAGAMVASDADADPDEYRLLIQVHDECLWERGPAWDGARSIAKLKAAGESGHGFQLDVPLVFDPAEVESWADKGVSQTGEGHVVKDRLAKARSDGMQARKASDYAADLRAMRHEGTAGSGDEKGVAKDRATATRAARIAREAPVEALEVEPVDLRAAKIARAKAMLKNARRTK